MNDGSNLFARISGVEIVEVILDTGEVALTIKAVNAVVDCDKAHVILWECNLHQHSCLEIFSAESGLVFDDNRTDLARVNVVHHLFVTGTVEVCAGVTVVNIVLAIVQIIIVCELFGDYFLIGSGTVHYLFRLKFIESHISTVLSGVANGDGSTV